MKTLTDCFGKPVRLTDERLAHILEHVEMASMAAEVERVLQHPQFVRQSRSDETVRLFYEIYAQTIGCALWLSMTRTMRLWSRLT